MRKLIVFTLVIFAAFLNISPSYASIGGMIAECSVSPASPLCVDQIAKMMQNVTSRNTGKPTSRTKNILSTVPKKMNAKVFLRITQEFMLAGFKMAQNFIPYAYGLTGILGGIAFVWLGIMIMLSQADIWHMGLRPMFILIFTVGFAYLLLGFYEYYTETLIQGFIFAGDKLIGTTGSRNALGNVINEYSTNFFNMVTFMSHVMDHSQVSGHWWDILGEICEDFFNALINVFFTDFTILISGVIFVLFVVIYLSYQIVAAVAIAVGPVFIPFMVLPVTKGLFDGWVKMLIMSGIYLMTSMVIVGLIASAFTVFSHEMAPPTTGLFLNIEMYIEIIIFELVGVLALLKTHEFAQTIGGSVNLSGMNAGNMVVSLGKKAVGL